MIWLQSHIYEKYKTQYRKIYILTHMTYVVILMLILFLSVTKMCLVSFSYTFIVLFSKILETRNKLWAIRMKPNIYHWWLMHEIQVLSTKGFALQTVREGEVVNVVCMVRIAEAEVVKVVLQRRFRTILPCFVYEQSASSHGL